MTAIDTTRILKDVAQQRTVNASVVALLNSLVAQNRELSGQLKDAIANDDQEAIAKVQSELDAAAADIENQQAALAQAVTQNTPAADPAGVQTNETPAAAPVDKGTDEPQADTSSVSSGKGE